MTRQLPSDALLMQPQTASRLATPSRLHSAGAAAVIPEWLRLQLNFPTQSRSLDQITMLPQARTKKIFLKWLGVYGIENIDSKLWCDSSVAL